MLQEVIGLEKLRQELERLEYHIGSLSDYLDRGTPDERQQRQALEQMAAHKQQSAAVRARLHDRLVTIRAQQPHVIEQWVQWHRDICQRILAETGGQSPRAARQLVARETLQAWEKVLRGEQDAVLINPYFLDDYGKEVARVIRRRRRKWWKVWG